jgi:Tfp pilus assembly pilus retraction ATPase PilT
MDLTQLLDFAKDNRASDVIIAPHNPAAMLVHGRLRRLKTEAFPPSKINNMMSVLLDDEQKERLARSERLRFVFALPNKDRYRVTLTKDLEGLTALIRVIDPHYAVLEDILPNDVDDPLSDYLSMTSDRKQDRDGALFVFCGQGGAGLTTTLAAIAKRINATQKKHLAYVQKSAEFMIAPDQSVMRHLCLDTMGGDRGRIKFPELAAMLSQQKPDIAIMDIGLDITHVKNIKALSALVMSEIDVVVTCEQPGVAQAKSLMDGAVREGQMPAYISDQFFALKPVFTQQFMRYEEASETEQGGVTIRLDFGSE